MPVFVMWSNGFLQTLEICPASRCAGGLFVNTFCHGVRRLNPFLTPMVTRIVAQPSGYWILETESGGRYEVNLNGGWIFGSGLCVGLYWKSDDGRQSFRSWLISWRQDPAVWRRLQVRLRIPV
jgi:hypothetical protein